MRAAPLAALERAAQRRGGDLAPLACQPDQLDARRRRIPARRIRRSRCATPHGTAPRPRAARDAQSRAHSRPCRSAPGTPRPRARKSRRSAARPAWSSRHCRSRAHSRCWPCRSPPGFPAPFRPCCRWRSTCVSSWLAGRHPGAMQFCCAAVSIHVPLVTCRGRTGQQTARKAVDLAATALAPVTGFGHIRTALLSQLTARAARAVNRCRMPAMSGPVRGRRAAPEMPPLTRRLEVCIAALGAAHEEGAPEAGRAEQRRTTMGTQRFDVGASASPAERTVKDSPVEFPLWPTVPAAQRPVRSAPREGFLRRRLHRRHQGPQVAQDRRGRDRDPVQSRASRRGRRRPARRRRRRHPGADAAQVLRRARPPNSASRCREPGHYAVGYVFMPHDPEWRKVILDIYAEKMPQEGLTLLGWRDVPHDNSSLGESVKPTEPFHMQVFIGRGPNDRLRGRVRAPALHPAQGHLRRRRTASASGGSRTTTSCRCRAARSSTRACSSPTSSASTIPTCTSRTSRPRSRWCTSASRPTRSRAGRWRTPIAWSRTTARSTRCAATSTGWRRGRPRSSSKLFGDDITKLWPISYEGQSDTACFDNALEFLVQGGYSLAHAAMMLIPEAWAGNPLMDEERKAFYEYHAALMEPWDGPAAIAFTDGRQIGATLDRNGLRPARWLVTDGRPRHHGVGSRRAADPGRARSCRSGACSRARCCWSTWRKAASSPTRRSRRSSPRQHPYAKWLKRTQIVLEDLPALQPRKLAHQPLAARSPAVLRLHPGRPAAS